MSVDALVHRAMSHVRRRIDMMVGRAVIAAVTDSGRAQTLQVALLDGETADGAERFQQYGLTSHPHPGAEAIAVSVGGLRSHLVVLAVEDRRYRVRGLAQGEVALYDDLGQVVVLKRDRISLSTPFKVEVIAGTEIDLTAPKVVVTASAEADVSAPAVTVTSPNVQLGGSGGKKVALDGDPVVAGKVVASAAKVFGQ